MQPVEVLYALGAGPGSPLAVRIAESGRGVLTRLGPPGLSEVRSIHVWLPVGALDIDGTRWSMYPEHPGACFGGLLDLHPEGVEAGWLAAIAHDAIIGLRDLHEAGLAHGDVRDGTLRVGVDGVARWVGIVGGDAEDDRRALSELLERALPDGSDEELCEAITQLDLARLETRAVPRGAPHLERREAGLHVGRTLADGAGATEPPPRLVVARISALVGMLALAVGWMMRPVPAASDVDVEVPGASSVGVRCESGTCVVSARMADRLVRAEVDVGEGGRYRCTPDEDRLVCEVVSLP